MDTSQVAEGEECAPTDDGGADVELHCLSTLTHDDHDTNTIASLSGFKTVLKAMSAHPQATRCSGAAVELCRGCA